MKYFTPDLIERYGSDDEATARAAHEEWESVLANYERSLQSFEAELPEHVRAFTQLLLHDAVVWSIARQGDNLIMVMRKDIPPREVVILTYTLIDEPTINKEALSSKHRSTIMDYSYDEFELVRDGNRTCYAQSIIFGNGWELSLRFSDVQVTLADPVYPLPNTMLVPVSTVVTAQSA